MWIDQDGIGRGEDEDVFVDEVGCSFGYIDGGGTLYVNSGIGERVGRWGGAMLVDVRKGVHRWTVARSD